MRKYHKREVDKIDLKNMHPVDLFSLWHTSDTKPDVGRRVLLLIPHYIVTCIYVSDVNKWDALTSGFSTHWWVYTEDIIPNAIKKQIIRFAEATDV